MKTEKYICALLLFFCCSICYSQKISLSTDVMGWAGLGTMNGEVSYSLARHWGIVVGMKYNPFSYDKGQSGKKFQARQRSYYIGTRYWPWHIYSGWWLVGRLRYQEYNMGGIFSDSTYEGDRLGSGIGFGYTYMLNPHFNIEFGLGLWAGYDKYTEYECPVCGLTVGKGESFFILPSDILIALAYVF
jgi:hypothetical protein